jgi:hypothetical protein
MPLTWDKDTRTFCLGAGLALTCGLMLGGAMRPDFGDDGRPAGPQQISGWSGVRPTGPFDTEPLPASYVGQVPDYVMGTDWKKTLAAPDQPAAAPPPAPRRVEVRDDDDALTTEALKAAWAEPPRRSPYDEPPPAERGRYPSLGGGAAADEPDEQAAPATG